MRLIKLSPWSLAALSVAFIKWPKKRSDKVTAEAGGNRVDINAVTRRRRTSSKSCQADIFLDARTGQRPRYDQIFTQFNSKFYKNSQNAGLRPAMLAIAVLVRRENLFCLDFTYGSLYSTILQQIAPVTSNGKNGRELCNKTFSVRKSRISARITDFSGFFSS